MSTPTSILPTSEIRRLAPIILGGLAFCLLFYLPFTTLLRNWWNDPEAQHGLLLGPLAIFLAWRKGIRDDAAPQPLLGLALLLSAVLLRYAAALAAEMFTLRLSLLGAALGLVVFRWGWRQAVSWWLPFALLFLSIPLPQVVLASLAFPLQLQASKLGAFLLETRQIPVLLQGNIINLPGQTLFVTEACSGLRSLTALISLGVLFSALWLRSPLARVLLLVAVLPIAILVNGVRVFLTGFLVIFVDPSMGEGFMHLTEGWVLFLVALILTGLVTAGFRGVEALLLRRSS